MKWPKSEGYSKSKVDWAGEILAHNPKSQDAETALKILDNWRAIHRYPLYIFTKRIKRISKKIKGEVFIAQRLKRLPSIISKIQREYLKGSIKHLRIAEKDYILNPKDDGYRSLHLIYKYQSDKNGKKDYNGLLVEIQLRTKLQHLWATAIETVDLFTKQAIKSNEGEENWKEFFRLVSSAFAIKEGTALAPNTPKNKKELYRQIKEKEKEINVVKIMSKWAKAVRIFERELKQTPDMSYFLLELDTDGEKLNITGYNENEEEKALEEYARIEKLNQKRKEYDVVLVGVEAAKDLRKAYPNYFADTKEFIAELERILNKS